MIKSMALNKLKNTYWLLHSNNLVINVFLGSSVSAQAINKLSLPNRQYTFFSGGI